MDLGDLDKLQPTAKVTYHIGGRPLTLEVRYMGADVMVDYLDKEKTSEKNRAMLADAIIGWDIVDEKAGRAPVPCDKANKDKLLPFILGRKKQIKNEQGVWVDGPTPIGWDLLGFVTEQANFLKN